MVPKISVIVPIYNVADYVGSTIESILNQTYKNWELILVDDGSPDNAGLICDEYAAKYPNIIVIHKQNAGVCAARISGVEVSTGEYITLLDGDDTLTPDALSVMAQYAERDKTDLVICNFIQVKNNITFEWRRFSKTGIMSKDEYFEEMIHFRLPLSTQARLFKKTVFDKVDLRIDKRIKNNEDFLTNLLLAQNMTSVSAYNTNVYVVATREGSASRVSYNFDYWIFLMKYVETNAARFGLNRIQLEQYVLTKTFHLLRGSNDLKFDFSDSIFDYIRSMKISSIHGFWEKVTAFVVKHPSQLLIKFVRIHPKQLIPYYRNRTR